MLSVHFAFAALRKDAFEVAWVPGYAFFSSRFVTTLIRSLRAASGLRLGDNSPRAPVPPGGVQRLMSEPIGT